MSPDLLTEEHLKAWLGYRRRGDLERALREQGVRIIYGKGGSVNTTQGLLLKAQEPIPATWDEARQAGMPGDLVAALQAAEEAGEVVELEYQSHAGVHVHWILPRGMEHNGPLYYLLGELIEERELRVFRADRVLSVRRAGDPAGEQPE